MMLIRSGCNINATNGNGCTALHVAANKGHKDMVACLIEGSADLNLKVSKMCLIKGSETKVIFSRVLIRRPFS